MARQPLLPSPPAGVHRLLKEIRLVVFDFDGVFTDNAVWVDEKGRESVRCWRSDGLGLARLRECGIEMQVLSTEKNPVVAARCRKLRLPCVQGCDDKLLALQKLLEKKGLGAHQTAFVGNDINDADCLRLVVLPILVADAYPEVLPLAKWVTSSRGGHGAVREVCDAFYFSICL